MSAIILDGKQIAKQIYSKISVNYEPNLVFILVGNNKDSKKYISSKIKRAKSLGFNSSLISLDANINQKDLELELKKLSSNTDVNGILLQLPLPKHLSFYNAVKIIDSKKDIDGLHPENLSALINKKDGLIPCTALGVLELIFSARNLLGLNKDISGLRAGVIGRSVLVGQPIAQLLLNHDCTVSVFHSKSQDIQTQIEDCDIVVTATGKRNLISKVKPSAIVIDVGINYENDKLCGDLDFDSISKSCAAITPVPGGVGPLTIAMLMKNVVKACQLQGLSI